VATNLLGIDYGSERVGVAISVDGQPPERLITLLQDDSFWDELAHLVSEHTIEGLVVGLPRTTDGDDSAWTARVRQLAAEAESRLGLEVALQDEFGTSQLAQERLGAKLSSADRKRVLDQEAAVIILEDYLREG
jgi:putative holliday junction resolvase